MTMITNPRDVKAYQAIVIKNALHFYAKHKMQVNSAYTPTAMLRTAGQLTGKTFKRGQYTEAAEALEELVTKLKAEKDAEAQANG